MVLNNFSMVVPNTISAQIAAAVLLAERNCAALLRNAVVAHSGDYRSGPVAAVAVQRSDDCRSAAHCNSAYCYWARCAVAAHTNGCHSARDCSVSYCSAKAAHYSLVYYRLWVLLNCLPLPMVDGLNLPAAACWSWFDRPFPAPASACPHQNALRYSLASEYSHRNWSKPAHWWGCSRRDCSRRFRFGQALAPPNLPCAPAYVPLRLRAPCVLLPVG